MPTEEEAREILKLREPGLVRLRAVLESELAKRNLVTVPAVCDSPRAGTLAEVDARDRACTAAREAGYARSSKLEAEAPAILAPIADEIGAIGIAVRVMKDNELVATMRLHPCSRITSADWSVGEESGPTVGLYRLSWTGRFQTAWDDGKKHGDGDFHRAVNASWSFPYQGARVEVTTCFVLDGTQRPK